MKLRLEDLTRHLRDQLSPVYLVSGDEVLLVQEACDAIRGRAREQGFTERHVWNVATGFDWDDWFQSAQTQSLFADRQLIDLRLPTGKPGDRGNKLLEAYCQDPGADNVLLITTGKLDAASQRSKWFKAVTTAGVHIPVWPLTLAMLPGWINRRLRARGMSATPEAVNALVERVEGNPLACAQEIEKLYLLKGADSVDVADVADTVADSARFDVYGLVDSAVDGDAERCVRILNRLRDEGVEPVLVLWALTREIRMLAKLAGDLAAGQSFEQACRQLRIWDKRKAMINKALSRFSGVGWTAALRQAAFIDRVIKGDVAGNPWDELLKLALRMTGVALFGRTRKAG